MRRFFLVLMILVSAAIIAVATGLVSVNQTQNGALPSISAEDGVVRAETGTAPQFEVETGTVAVGTVDANVAVPKVRIETDETTIKVPQVEVRPADEVKDGTPAAPAAQ